LKNRTTTDRHANFLKRIQQIEQQAVNNLFIQRLFARQTEDRRDLLGEAQT